MNYRDDYPPEAWLASITKEGTILYQEGEWCLYMRPGGPTSLQDTYYIIAHIPCYWIGTVTVHETCSMETCDKPIPKVVKDMIKLLGIGPMW